MAPDLGRAQITIEILEDRQWIEKLVLSLARTGRKGTYRIGVAAGLRRPVNAMIDPLRLEWQKAGLSIEIRTGTIRPD